MTKLGMYDIWGLEVCEEMCFHQNFLASVVIFPEEWLISSPRIMILNLFAIIINCIWR